MAPPEPTSLRTGKSTGPKLLKQPTTRSVKRTNVDTRKSRVDDKIKRRMSMRYADISIPQPTENIPALPGIRPGFRPTHARTESEGSLRIKREKQKEEARAAEHRLLDKQDFDPDVCEYTPPLSAAKVKRVSCQTLNSSSQILPSLSYYPCSPNSGTRRPTWRPNSSAMYSRSVHTGLLVVKVADMTRLATPTSCSFQRKSTCWRTRCLNSRTVSPNGKACHRYCTSKSPHRQLVTMHGVSSSFVVVDVHTDRRRNVRSSVADLRILYANQMQNLHSQIEGAAKYVPTMPGRHIITEMDGVLALNAATYKVDHAVKFVVLDDAVLVARRRRRRNNTESEKLVAERCWMLGEMLVLDSKDATSGCSGWIPFETDAIL